MDAITKSLTERERERSSMDSRTHGLTDFDIPSRFESG